MIHAISSSYLNTAWVSRTSQYLSSAPIQNTKEVSVSAVRRSAALDAPVQAVEAAKPVTSKVSGNLNVSLPLQKGADPAELAVRMRINGKEENADTSPSLLTEKQDDEKNVLFPPEQTAQPGATAEELRVVSDAMDIEENGKTEEESGAMQEALTANKAEQEEKAERAASKEPSAIQKALEAEQAEKEEKAEAAREAEKEEKAREVRKEAQNEAETKREERIDALREAQNEELSPGEEASAGQPVDRTASVLQGQQMQFLFQEQTRAQNLGLKDAGYQVQTESSYYQGRIQFSVNLSRDPAAVEQERQVRYEQLSANIERRYPSFMGVA